MKKKQGEPAKEGSKSEAKGEELENIDVFLTDEEALEIPELPECEDATEESDSSEATNELCELKDRYIRLLAEYDNYRRRTQKERDGLYSDAVAEITKEWLPVIDNVERALQFAGDDNNDESLSEGVRKIYKQALEVLTKLKVEEISCESGTPFDPNLHAAVMHIEDDNFGEQTVTQVFLKGYRAGDKVIRHVLVQVAN